MKRYLISLIVLANTALSPLKAQLTPRELRWEVAYADKENETPGKWISATVPGAVQLDVARAEKYHTPFFFAEHWKEYGWMEDKFYTYKTTFNKPSLEDGEQLHFISKGVDYECNIYINGKKIFHQEGMFKAINIDLTPYLEVNNVLLVKVFPAPKRYAFPLDRGQALYAVKPAISYGGDWHPRLIPLGIWDDTYLQVQAAAHADDITADYQLSDDLQKAAINLKLKGRNLSQCSYTWTLKDMAGKEVMQKKGNADTANSFILTHPQLWWTHDHGTPYLYTATTKLYNASGKLIQTETTKIGFRKVKLVMNKGAWDEPAGFPKTRSAPPIQVELNGRRIFCKGANWVNPEVFPGTITRNRYDELLSMAKTANFNLLRAWGGAIVNKESFFELCNEKGLLVWQEFPLVCNNYPDDPHYLAVLEQEATAIILRVRKHPSLLLWSGGNELFNNWSGMTDQSLALRLLNKLCLELDPQTPFMPTSPLMGMGHGHYVFRDWDTREEVFQAMPRSHFTAYIEFGMPSPAPVEVLKQIIPKEELWPARPGTSWESHHAYKAWIRNTWLCEDIIEDYFGPAPSLETLVANGQLMQGEGFKCIYENARRQKPYCSMALNWCFNEPWPTAANNSQISYPNIPKPAYYEIKNACRPFLASAQFRKFKWTEGEVFEADLWMLNDLPVNTPAGKVTIKLEAASVHYPILTWAYHESQPDVNIAGPTARYKLPALNADRFKILLEVEGHPEYSSSYTFLYRQLEKKVEPSVKVLNQ